MEPPRPRQNTMGLVSLILGIASVPLVLCYPLGLLAGVAAVVLGTLGVRKANQGLASNRGQAIAGLACGAAGVAIMLIVIALPD